VVVAVAVVALLLLLLQYKHSDQDNMDTHHTTRSYLSSAILSRCYIIRR
jgi:hypothetical protein